MRIVLLLTALLTLNSLTSAQSQNWAPVAWERYKISSQNLSFLLPKMPMVAKGSDDCESKHMARYMSYAEGSVYEMELVTRVKDPICVSSKPRPFGAATLEKRLNEFRNAKDGLSESKETIEGKIAYRFEKQTSTRVIIVESMDPKWWIELAVYYHADKKPDVDKFLKSLTPKAEGKEIGRGSEVMIGDPIFDSNEAPLDASLPRSTSDAGTPDEAKRNSYVTLYQPRATYTEKARKANTEGAVRLKITLQKNGAVGAVVPVIGLDNGLTDMAIEAAKRIVFLPKRVGGKPVSVIVTREYTFTIY